MTELQMLIALEPLATADTRRYLYEAMRRVKAGERNVPIRHLVIR